MNTRNAKKNLLGNSYIFYEDAGHFLSARPDYEGVWVEHWPNGQIKYKGKITTGTMRHGQHISYYEDGSLSEVSYWKDGWIVGTLIQFHESGKRSRQVDFGENGGFDRSYTERVYIDDTLWSVTIYKEGKQIKCWINQHMFDAQNNPYDSLVLDALQQMMSSRPVP